MDCVFVGAGAVAAEYPAGPSDSRLAPAGVCDLDGNRAERGLSPTRVVPRNVARGVVQIPPSNTDAHVVSKLRAAGAQVTEANREPAAVTGAPESER